MKTYSWDFDEPSPFIRHSLPSQVIETKMVHYTGLLNVDGKKIYRQDELEPVGFVVFKEK